MYETWTSSRGEEELLVTAIENSPLPVENVIEPRVTTAGWAVDVLTPESRAI